MKQIQMQQSTSRPLKVNPNNSEPRQKLLQKRHIQQLMEQDESGRTQLPIFTKEFAVDPIQQPKSFLPNYHESANLQPSCVQNCLGCCGEICMKCGVLGALCCCKCCCVYELSSSSAGLVETFGKFNRMLKPGFNIINPCTDQVSLVNLKIQTISVGRHTVITKDNVNLSIQASIAFRVVNPIVAHYVLGYQINNALIELTISSLRNVVGSFNLDEVLRGRVEVTKATIKEITIGLPQGISVERIFMEEISVPKNIESDLSSAARQRRLAQGNLIQTKADVESAKLMKQSAQLLDTKAAMQIRYLEMIEDLSQRQVTVLMEIGVNKKGFKQSQ